MSENTHIWGWMPTGEFLQLVKNKKENKLYSSGVFSATQPGECRILWFWSTESFSTKCNRQSAMLITLREGLWRPGRAFTVMTLLLLKDPPKGETMAFSLLSEVSSNAYPRKRNLRIAWTDHLRLSITPQLHSHLQRKIPRGQWRWFSDKVLAGKSENLSSDP